jgi:glucokinase
MILAGDIGGTKTNLAYFSVQDGQLQRGPMSSYASREYVSLSDIVRKFLADNSLNIQIGGFGIAGPVINNRCEATNLPWVVDARAIGAVLGVSKVVLLNDLEATAYGTLRLTPSDTLIVNSGSVQPNGAIAVIAAGTGLGEGGLVWNGSRYQALPSEGGHTDFAPRNEMEMRLLHFLLTKYKRVSYERVVSGMGIANIYQFFRTQVKYAEPEWLALAMTTDAAAAISTSALSGKDEACVKTMEMFVSLYAAEAGNLALKLLSTAGIYIGGGIAPKILPLLQQSTFMDSFANKGRLSPLLKNMPVSVVLNDKTALFGAAHYALMMYD